MEAGTVVARPGPHAEAVHPGTTPRTGIRKWLLTSDHKLIGTMYIWLAFFFFAIAGAFAMVMRTQLAAPGLHVLRPEVYNQIMSLHGTFMVFFFTIPIMAGIADYVVPLLNGARDIAFPPPDAVGLSVPGPARSRLFADLVLQRAA